MRVTNDGSGRRNSFGMLLFVLILAEYLFPWLVILVQGGSELYRTPELNFSVFFHIAALGVLCVILVLVFGVTHRRTYRLPKLKDGTINLAILTLAGAAVVGWVLGASGFRYANEGMLASGGITATFFSLSSVFGNILPLYLLFYQRQWLYSNSTVRLLIKSCLIVAVLASINGLGTAISASISAVIILFPVSSSKVIFRNSEAGTIKPFQVIVVAPLVFVGALGVATLGFSAKTGDSSQGLSFFDNYLSSQYMVERTSPQLYSLLLSVDGTSEFEMPHGWMVVEPLSNGLFRLDSLAGGPMGLDRPELGSMSRVNLVNIEDYNIGEREGTSPGLFAGFFIGFELPINFAFIFLYLCLTAWILQPLLKAIDGSLTLVGYFIFSRGVFTWLVSSPLDLLQILDESFIVLCCLVVLRLRVKSTVGRRAGQT